ncbi:MAG: DUF86 domain-containing protein [Chitinophagaceae bacterium]|jgi:uncharacterized protein with HEPN domain|nr:DUF86 domain-containing protein [Chitinophagaceae bacterium]MCU0403632.1 DUF86 domain-containing protein [Chitinophagaceae bacterium]
MYDSKNLLYLLTILECIEKVFIYSKDINTAEEFLWVNDQMNFNACTNLLIAIGEDSKKIDSELKENFPQFPWKDIAGMRNVLAHDYRGIDPEILFGVIREYINELKEIMISLVSLLHPDHNELKEYLNSPHYSHIQYLTP